MDADRYLFTAGVLHGVTMADATLEQIEQTMWVNYAQVAKACELIIKGNDNARICVVGSESGISGSYDTGYGGAKAALHHYVETKKLRTPEQQLVCVAPGIIGDAGMTMRREDQHRLDYLRESHPKRRFMSSHEVAAMIYHLLYIDLGYTSGTVIRMNGGRHTSLQ